jgi:hypothetical protein
VKAVTTHRFQNNAYVRPEARNLGLSVDVSASWKEVGVSVNMSSVTKRYDGSWVDTPQL